MENPNYKTIEGEQGVVGEIGKYAIQIAADLPGLELSSEEQTVISKAFRTVRNTLLGNIQRRMPKEQERRAQERAELLGCFSDPIYVKEIPNQYCHDWCCKHRPWFEVTTRRGKLVLGWRKRVIEIRWDESDITVDGRELFASEDVTKDKTLVHAWGIDKAKLYIDSLLSA